MDESLCDQLPTQESIWRGLWVVLGLTSVIACKSEWLHGFVGHGKGKRDASVDHMPLAKLLQLDIPKSTWKWFYFTGSVENWLLVAGMLNTVNFGFVDSALTTSCPKLNQNDNDTMLTVNLPTTIAVIIYTCHVTRRLLESFLITSFGDSKMHVGVFILGVLHYMSVPLSILADSNASQDEPVSYSLYVGAFLFLYASFRQYKCNTLLAKQKVEAGGKYVVPKGDWFDYVRCPLYSAEILLYISMSLMLPGNFSMHLCMAWVFANQIMCALYGNVWYEEKFREKLPEMAKWVLIPGIW